LQSFQQHGNEEVWLIVEKIGVNVGQTKHFGTDLIEDIRGSKTNEWTCDRDNFVMIKKLCDVNGQQIAP